MLEKITFMGFWATVLIFTTALISPVFASDSFVNTGKTVSLSKEEVVNHDLLVAAGQIDIAGTVEGDVIALGGLISISGNVKGDILAAGGTINLSGKTEGNVRVAGGEVTVSGQIGRNLSVVSGVLELKPEAAVGGSTQFAAGNIYLRGKVEKDLLGGVGRAIVDGKIGRNAELSAGQLTVERGADIGGSLTYISSEKADISERAVISGETIHKLPPQETYHFNPQKFWEVLFVAQAGIKLLSFLSLLAIGLLIMFLVPNLFTKVTEKGIQKVGQSLLIGFLVVILFPILFMLLMITIIGIPIAVIVSLILALLAYLSNLFVSFVLGKKILEILGKKKTAPLWILAAGLFVWILLTSIPVFGWVMKLFGLFFGLGALFLTGWSWFQNRKKMISGK